MHIQLRTSAAAVAAGCLLLSTPASAFQNGGFESDLTGWTTVGDVSIQTGAYGAGPSVGLGQALITNAVDGDDATNLNASGTAPEPVGLDPGLETGLGLTVGDLDGFFADFPTEGSGLVQSFNAWNGSRIVFDWNFLTNDDVYADFAFVAIDGVVSLLVDSLSAALVSSATPFEWETGFNTFSSDILSAGIHSLVVGVVDLTDFTVSSALLLDNVQLVPLPGTPWLLGAGLLGYLGARSRPVRRRTA